MPTLPGYAPANLSGRELQQWERQQFGLGANGARPGTQPVMYGNAGGAAPAGGGGVPSYGGYIPQAGGASGGYGGAPGGFNLNPQPQAGQGAFGAVPGPLGLPNPAGDLAQQVPGLSSLNSGVSSNILSKLQGQLSPGTINALQNAQAQFGASSGMPGSGLSWNSLYGNIAGAAEAQQQQGIQDYNSWIPTVSGTQTVSPALQNEIATQNSLNAAAPNPTQAASYAKQLFDQYLASMRGPGGGMRGPGGGPGGGPGDGTIPRPRPTSGGGAVAPPPTSIPGLFGGQNAGTFGGASSYDPNTWAQWEDELFGPVGDFMPNYSDAFQPPGAYDYSNFDDYAYA